MTAGPIFQGADPGYPKAWKQCLSGQQGMDRGRGSDPAMSLRLMPRLWGNPNFPPLFWGHLVAKEVAAHVDGTGLQPRLTAPPAWGPSARSRGGLAHRQFSPETNGEKLL